MYDSAVHSVSCAQKAALPACGRVAAVDKTPVPSGTSVRGAVRASSAGESATLTVSRSGETLKLTVTFDRASDSTK